MDILVEMSSTLMSISPRLAIYTYMFANVLGLIGKFRHTVGVMLFRRIVKNDNYKMMDEIVERYPDVWNFIANDDNYRTVILHTKGGVDVKTSALSEYVEIENKPIIVVKEHMDEVSKRLYSKWSGIKMAEELEVPSPDIPWQLKKEIANTSILNERQLGEEVQKLDGTTSS